MSGLIPFDRDARHRIFELTRGVPRRINLLCDRALLGAYASGRQRVDRAIVDKAAGEVFDMKRNGAVRWSRRRLGLVGGSVAVGALVLGGVALAWVNNSRRGAGPATPAASASAAASSAASPASAAASGVVAAVAPASAPAAPASAAAPTPAPATKGAIPGASATARSPAASARPATK